MDITYTINNNKFKYRVGAIIINDNKLLAMHDERSPYYYLPGGKVKMNESAEQAIIREIQEELNIECNIIRPLWLSQSFFNEDVDKIDYHELCIYYLIELSDKDLCKKDKFTLNERKHTFEFKWLEFDKLKDEYLYPLFIKKEIYNLPEHFTIRTDYE